MNSYISSEEKNLHTLKRFRLVAIVALLAAVLLRTLSLLFFYDAEIGYYRAGAILPIILYVLFLLAALTFGVLAFTMSKEDVPVPQPNAATKIASLAVGAVFAVTALLRYCLSATEMSRATVFVFITGGLAAIYFVLLASKKLSPAVAILSGFAAILWLGSVLLDSYFDLHVAMNSPEKLGVHLACAGGMLLMLGEMRLACSAMKKRFYLFSLSLGTLSLCVASLPSLIADAAGVFGTRELAFADFTFLALGIFGVIRLLSAFAAEKEESVPESVECPSEEAPEETPATADEKTTPDNDTTDCE